MINLLPYEDRKVIEREGFRRFLIIALFSISLVLFLGIVLMAPIYLMLRAQSSNLKTQEQFSLQGAPLDRLKKAEEEARKLNSEAALIESASQNTSVPEIFQKIIEARPSGISLRGFSFRRLAPANPGTIALEGNALTRENLSSFVTILEGSGLFAKVDSPVSNILKKTNISFSLNLILKQP